MMGSRPRLQAVLALFVIALGASCEHVAAPDDGTSGSRQSLSSTGQNATSRPLKVHARENGLYFGTAVYLPELKSTPGLTRAVLDETSIVTPVWDLEWEPSEPVPGGHDFRGADAVVSFAHSRGLNVRGNAFLWFRRHPKWLASVLNPSNADSILRRHIEVTASRYRGRIQSWDVINEAVEPRDGRPDGLRKDIWLTMLGTDYIARAFRYARAADPKAQLVYNEYGLETDTPAAALRRTAVLALLQRLVAEEVPIDAFGFQLHIEPSVRVDTSQLKEFLDAVSALGLSIILTEVDVDDRDMPANVGWRDAMVAAALSRYLTPFVAHPAVEGIITWGISDKFPRAPARSDRLPPRGLPLDEKFQRKPAWHAIAEAIAAAPRECVERNSLETGDRRDGPRRGAFECRRSGAP
jgi:endo-1,4-beta-xylanase